MRTVWRICVPIAITEVFSRDLTRPWLGNAGLTLTGVVFVAGSVLFALAQHDAKGSWPRRRSSPERGSPSRR
ncbi:hypothetical protein ACH4SK_27565 [Streptomyces inhibens]|uniref:hypothetical protein n=1 Tax=Streptomyces inhibens TaxID=2293571 RepID=UPI0037B3B1C5